MAAVRGWRLFFLELQIVRLLFKGGDYSKKYGIRKYHNRFVACNVVSV